jgi:glycosyltransferase involved in cell wall biosynthesis
VNPAAFVIPAFDAARSVPAVVEAVVKSAPQGLASPLVIVVDDGSSDETAIAAARAGAIVIRHAANRGKGAALRTGFQRAFELGALLAVTLDADGQHPASEAWKVALHPAPHDALILGTRDLALAGAPRLNQASNRISNFFLSALGRRRLLDTQCGLRRYPLEKVLHCQAEANGYAYEAEVLLIAARQGWTIEQVPVEVIYPPEEQRITHFHNVKDPARIVSAVLRTLTRSND